MKKLIITKKDIKEVVLENQPGVYTIPDDGIIEVTAEYDNDSSYRVPVLVGIKYMSSSILNLMKIREDEEREEKNITLIYKFPKDKFSSLLEEHSLKSEIVHEVKRALSTYIPNLVGAAKNRVEQSTYIPNLLDAAKNRVELDESCKHIGNTFIDDAVFSIVDNRFYVRQKCGKCGENNYVDVTERPLLKPFDEEDVKIEPALEDLLVEANFVVAKKLVK